MNIFSPKHFDYKHLKIASPTPSEYHRHIHGGYELLYFLSGEAEFMINASTYRMKKRDLLLIQPGDYHYLIPNPNVPYERICLHFSEQVIPEPLKDRIADFKPVYHLHKHSAIDNLFSALPVAENEMQYSKEDVLFLAGQTLGSILLHLCYLQSESSAPIESNHLLGDMLEYIDANVQSHVNVDVLSKVFFKSTSWISHAFSEKLNIPVQEYINNRKIVHAQALIAAGEQPTKVAAQLSFKNYSTFFKAYKKFLGNSPADDMPKRKE